MKTQVVENLQTVRHDLTRKQANLKAEMEAITADIEAIDRMLSRYQGQTALELGVSVADSEENDQPNEMTFKDAILKVLGESHPRPLRAADVRRGVLRLGFKPKAKSFSGATFAMLSNLYHQGLLIRSNTGLYGVKPQREK